VSRKDLPQDYTISWESLKPDWPLWLVLGVMLAAAFIFYPLLPERVPVHWNWKGEVDAYGTRLQVAFTAPLLALGIYLLMLVTPLIDPGRRNYPRFAGAYRLLRWGLVLFMAWIYGIWMAPALGHSVDILLAVKLSVSLLLLAIGDVMGQLRHNYFNGHPHSLDLGQRRGVAADASSGGPALGAG